MPSERRLHPLSFLFQVGGQLQQLIVPALVVLVGAGSAGVDWQPWMMLLIVPYAAAALLRSLSFRYRFDDTELVVTKGFVFRSERHIPYTRIHNIDAVQNVFHRLAHVVEVRIETGGGAEAEAVMRVLPDGALEEMRAQVLARRGASLPAAAAASPEAPARRIVLRLRPRDLLLAGFVESRGLVIVSAAFGLLWELGLFDRTMDMVFGKDVSSRGLVRDVVRGLFGGGMPAMGAVAFAAAAFAAVLLGMRVLSMAWSLLRLHGFQLDRAGDDLRAEFGLFTRVMTTIPLQRIQTLTIREGLLHRLFGLASVRVDSAGSDARRQAGAQVRRESLAPVVRLRELPQLLHEVLPDVDVSAVAWQPVDPRSVRRAFVVSFVFYSILTLPFVVMLRWWTLALLVIVASWSLVNARLYVRHLGWALADRAVLFRSGWMARQVTVARFAKIQVVSLVESPFDRRAGMASVRVDTAGAANLSHRVNIPYLSRALAGRLYSALARQASQTAFRW
ncbi:MAG TPA: PH domain-containing protein [Vicinamibacterales bacterium]|nr:PH domain-containing protein [Vicinamibacterales bacterium]